MSPGDDCLISNVLRGVALAAGEESRLGSKLAEVAPGVLRNLFLALINKSATDTPNQRSKELKSYVEALPLTLPAASSNAGCSFWIADYPRTSIAGREGEHESLILLS